MSHAILLSIVFENFLSLVDVSAIVAIQLNAQHYLTHLFDFVCAHAIGSVIGAAVR